MKGGWSSDVKTCRNCDELFRARSNPKTNKVADFCPKCRVGMENRAE